ncbi:MAG: CBS domain-containing protein [Clostridiaceae bacterium]|nr:CBS domain-containing protein [Clostridiaceae bacterium]
MKVRDIMTKSVAYVNPNNTVVETAQLMQKHNVGSIPVYDQTQVVGIITDRDIVVRNVAHGKNPQSTKAQDVMTSMVTTVSPDMDVDEASEIMSKQQIRRLPVVENNQIVGIVAIGDIATDMRYDSEASKALSEISKPSKPYRI